MKITIIGAGKTGRGFLARLFKDNDITFIDKDNRLIDRLNEKKTINISYFGEKTPSVSIFGFKAFTWDKIDKITDELIFVSVGGRNLADVGEKLKTRINGKTKIIVCENASSPAKTLQNAIGAINGDYVKIAESTVFCTTIENGDVDISSEKYPYLQYDSDAFCGEEISLDRLKPIKNFGNFLTRKLYTYNSASCIIAYLGYKKGYTVYSDAANDPEILKKLDKNYEIINECMCREYGYDAEDQKEFAYLSRVKFTDKTIADTVSRNAREPQRKITRYERVTGPLFLETKYGKDTSVLEETLAAMLNYTPENETEWIKMLEEKGKGGILTELCGIEEDSLLYNKILALSEEK